MQIRRRRAFDGLPLTGRRQGNRDARSRQRVRHLGQRPNRQRPRRVQTRVLVHDRKQFARDVRGLGAAEQEEAARVQREVKGFEHRLLRLEQYVFLFPQQAVLETFHFALNPRGFLLLGGSETADVSSELFSVVDKNARLYAARSLAVRPLPQMPDALPAPRVTVPLPATGQRQPVERPSAADLHLQILELYGPPSVVVNDDHQIVHISARAGRYCRLAEASCRAIL